MAIFEKKNKSVARKPKASKPNVTQPFLQDRTIWYSDLAYMPPHLKNDVWAAQMIYYAKKNGKLFLDPKRARAYRALDALIVDPNVYRQMFDPITPMGDGGKAEYVSSDWKANPIYIHLKNIIKAEIQRTGKNIEVNLTDKYAKIRKMKENEKIVYGKIVRAEINAYNKSIGKKELLESQDPFKWIASQQAKEGIKPAGAEVEDTVTSYVDLIKSQIQDSQTLALFNELIYKGDYEIGFELGIKHYMFGQNKWDDRWADDYIDDIMHFNKAAGEYYTDLITGRPVINKYTPELLWTSPFKRKDGEDIMYYFTEWDITFADFVRTVGATLPPEKLKAVFEYNKTQGSNHGLNWAQVYDNQQGFTRSDAMIRIGKMAALTQDYDVDMDKVAYKPFMNGNNDLTWETGADQKQALPQSKKHYNVWYNWYYIPPTTNSLSNADYAWQAQFIFKIEKVQDMYRFGENGRYCKSPLVLYDNSSQSSFTDMVEAYMPKINYAWLQYQNCLVSDIEASILSDELIAGLLSAVDEDNNIANGSADNPSGGNGQNPFLAQWKMIKQRGTGFLKMTDKQGNHVLDPNSLQLVYKNGQLDRAERFMMQMMNLYDMLTRTLARPDATEGQDVKPRTNVAAIQEGIKSSNNATWFVQKQYEAFIKIYAERFVSYIISIFQEAKELGYTKRLDEFLDVVGAANGLLVDGMGNIPPESVGMSIDYIDNAAKKDFIMQLAVERVKNGLLDDDFIYLIMGADNWKYAYVLMAIGINRRKMEMAHKEDLDHQRQMEIGQQQLQIAITLQQNKDQGKIQNTQTQGQIEQVLQDQLIRGKTASQMAQKDQNTESKLTEMNHAAQLEAEKPIDAVAT